MSYHNKSSDHYQNSSYNTRNSLGESYNENFNQFRSTLSENSTLDVSNSRLEPTAQEFHPASQDHVTNNSNNGAIKKNKSHNSWWNGRGSKNRYGSGRTFNSRNNYPKNENKSRAGSSLFAEEQNKVLKDAAEFLEAQSNLKPNIGESSTSNHNDDYSLEVSRNLTENDSYYQPQRIQHNMTSSKPGKNSYYHPKNDYYENPGNKYYDRGGNNDRSGNNYRNFNSKGQGNKNNYYNNSYKNSYESTYDKNDYSNQGRNSYDRYNRGYQRKEDRNMYDRSQNISWRNKEKNNKHSTKNNKILDSAGQRERLIEMVNRRLLECLVCCEKVKHTDKIWSCMQCYHIMHLNCIAAWAKSSKIEDGWRCPACQNVCPEVPETYHCYCGKNTDPKYDPSIVAHGCGEMCLKRGRDCEHKCTILCHPGPCPDCSVMVSKPCGCGATQQVVKCSTDLEILCDAVCNKFLECGVHHCSAKCHLGPCDPCDKSIIQECYCGKTGRKVPCTKEYVGCVNFSCDNVCGKDLSCGNHKCQKMCHEGPCNKCERDIELVLRCYCGKTPLENPRTSCTDPIPKCDKICDKILKCGQPNAPHTCKEKCHEGDCPPCPLTTIVRCRCGHMDKELPCRQVTTKADDARCEKKCTKKRMCGKHKCNQRCCIEIEHFCPLPCNHQLSCGNHRCQRTCHSGRCPPCMETSFEELYCECGASVLYPPVPCGTKPPTCYQQCSRTRPCGHETNHYCHSGPCPPCFVLSKRWCYGHHEQRSAIPCSQENFSCGLPCGKPMPCGRHKCAKPCHDGKCPEPCRQPCTVVRALCGHPCNKPCHDPPCPESPCKSMVVVTCLCGLQKATKPCTDLTDEFKNLEMAQLKEKMGDLAKDQTVDISDIGKIKKPSTLKILECNDECRVLERNRRLAIGLQIRNPDLSQKLTPRYSDFMRQWAKKDSSFCQKVHDKLTELVQLSKQSKQKSRSHSFESMNKDKRYFVHEYCEHFGVDSAAYDMEPNRNVVATAIKDKSWLPSMSLLEVIQRENGLRKVPGPVLSKSSTGKSETVSLKLSGTRPQRSNSPPPAEVIDYFNLT